MPRTPSQDNQATGRDILHARLDRLIHLVGSQQAPRPDPDAVRELIAEIGQNIDHLYRDRDRSARELAALRDTLHGVRRESDTLIAALAAAHTCALACLFTCEFAPVTNAVLAYRARTEAG